MAVDAVPSMIDAFVTRADLADLALFIWASGASTAAAMLLRELAAANRRFDAFVRELHRFNARHADD
ncbi:hypothetical protein [uncultured Alsobacter sp.]|uniref:hypothetical protein n=1 Tax=uncultured Alsobacter sp. TaxID=1748258 RepID=UPI0025EED861|nr:hypothetical protein [uncultured Alsobacter sp.]